MKPLVHHAFKPRGLAVTGFVAASLIGNILLAAPAQAVPAIGPTRQTVPVNRQNTFRRSALAANQSTAYSNAILSSAPIAFYRLNDSGATLVDSSANGGNGTYGPGVLQSAPTLTSTNDLSTAFPGGAYNLNNVASVPANTRYQPASSVSVEAWVDTSSLNASRTYVPMVAYGRQAQGSSYEISVSPQNAVFFYVNTVNGGVGVQSKTTLVPGRAYHVVATYDGAAICVYVDNKMEATKPVSGAINYSAVHPWDGIGIGGGLDGSQPTFAGSLSEVSLYNRALPPAEIQSHYIASVKPTLINEVPAPADTFVNMEGVNTHLHYTQTVYATNFPAIQSLLVGLGMRHIRDGLDDTTWQPYYDNLNALGAAGIKATFITDRSQTADLITAYPQRVANSIEAFEGPNEQDLVYASDPQWAQKARAFQQLLYTTVHGNSATKMYPVEGPSIVNQSAMQTLGNLSAYMDNGNTHQYFSAYNPGTAGWGSTSSYGTYGSIPWNIAVGTIVAGSKPTVVTETGYTTGAGITGNVPPDVQAKYAPRTFLEMFNQGIRRAEIYELVDVNDNFGLVNGNLSPKPAYYALMNMNALLADKGPSFTPTPFSFLLSGNISNVHHLLLEKRDGSYYLVMWIETPSWLPASGTGGGGSYVPVATQNVTLALPAAPHSIALSSWDTAGSVTTTAVPSSMNVALPVGDSISVVHIVP